MGNCLKCGGLGYIETDHGCKTCTCKISESIKLALSKHKNVLLAKDKKFNLELFPENTVLSTPSLDKMNSILKTVFTYMYLKDRVKSLDIIDSHTLMESYFEKSDYYSISSIKEAEFIVIIIDGEKQNKLLPEVINNITSYRRNLISKPTWIVYVSDSGKKFETISLYQDLVKSLNTDKFTFRGIK